MTRAALVAFALMLPAAASAADPDAKTLAQEILTKGATLFDTRDAAAMAATYTDDGTVSLITKDKSTGKYKVEDSNGRAAVERGYQEAFKDRKPGTTSRNDVEFAQFVGSDMLVIYGKFTLDVTQEGALAFVQTRVKEGDKWLILRILIYVPE